MNGDHCVDMLMTAVVDITTLISTTFALKSMPLDGALTLQPKLRSRLRREIRRGTVAYIDVLARTERGAVDAALLAACRGAAERHMRKAIENQELLRGVMVTEAGSLDGLAPIRHDLWRLAHMAMYLRIGGADLLESGGTVDLKKAESLGNALRRRFRKALVAYAHATLRSKESTNPLIAKARGAALAKIGKRGAAQAQRLADMEAEGAPKHTVVRRGVVQPLADLSLDWRRAEAG